MAPINIASWCLWPCIFLYNIELDRPYESIKNIKYNGRDAVPVAVINLKKT